MVTIKALVRNYIQLGWTRLKIDMQEIKQEATNAYRWYVDR